MNYLPYIWTEPADTDGVATGDGDWRFAVQMLVAEGGNRVGKAKVGSAKVGGGIWIDLDHAGVTWQQGSKSVGQGYPNVSAGTATITLPNTDHAYSSWNQGSRDSSKTGSVATSYAFHRELTPGALIRIVYFKPGCSSSYSVDGSGLTSGTRTDWYPLFTGFAETWSEEVINGSNVVNLTVVETLSFLAGVTYPATTPFGDGDYVTDRIVYIASIAGWGFGFTEGTYWTAAGGLDYYTEGGLSQMQDTTLSMNRWQEIQLTAQSAYACHVACNGDGSLRIGLNERFSVSNPATFDGAIAHFTDYGSNPVTADATNLPNAVTAHYQGPLVITNSTDTVVNVVTFAKAGGTSYFYNEPASIGFGIHSLTRTNLLNNNDAAVDWIAQEFLHIWDGWNDNADIDQTLQPGTVIVTDEHEVQRMVGVMDAFLLDHFAGETTPQVRFLGRVAHMIHTVVKTSTGISWQTAYTTVSTHCHKPSI